MDIEALDEGLLYDRATFGKVTYVIRELDITEYTKTVAKATGENGRIDNVLLLRLLVAESVRIMPAVPLDTVTDAALWDRARKPEPKFLGALPTHIARRLNDIVNDMHYGDVESEEDRAAAKAAAAEVDDGDSSGEADASGPQPT